MTYDLHLKIEGDSTASSSNLNELDKNGKYAEQQAVDLTNNRNGFAGSNNCTSLSKSVVKKSQHSRNLSNISLTNSTNKSSRNTSKKSNHGIDKEDSLEETATLQVFFTYLCYTILDWFGHLREFMRKTGLEKRKGAAELNQDGFAPLFQSFESFHTRNVYIRNRDCFNRPVCGVPGAEIELLDRKSHDYNWTYYYTGKKIKAINMGSYNYLGFAENNGPSSTEAIKSVNDYGVATCSARQELGTLKCQQNLESLLANFLGVESALTFGMGFATNAVNIPALVDKKCLILSDELNHVSLILGSRLSGATIQVFKHNNPQDLEAKLKKAIIEGHPVTKRAWKKILIVIEGVYSMEGTMPPLPEIIAIKKKYKAYLYLDEAHSIGAVGPSGRGVVEHFGCDPKDIDILMGTFSKSFGAAGGYVAGSSKLINYIKHQSHAQCYASSMCPAVCLQITKTLEIIMGLDGTNEGVKRIRQLKENIIYFREKLIKMGFIVFGNKASPVVPAMLYMPTKVAAFNRMMLEKGIAIVTVGFPATVLAGGRVRFCVSAAHTREMLDKVLEASDYCGHWNGIKLSKHNPPRTFQQVKDLENINKIET